MLEYLSVPLILILLPPAFYLGVPLLIRFQQRYPARPKLKVLDLERLDRSIARFLMSRAQALFDVGFEEPTLVRLPNPAPNVSGYLIMLVNRRTGDKAMVTALVGQGVTTQQTCYVEFSTRFEGGEVFNTMNSRQLLAFPPAPLTVRTQAPSVTDTQELFRLHTFVMARHDVRGNKVVYPPDGALEYLVEYAFVRMYDIQVERGLLSYHPDGDFYQPTFKGAYLICWGLMQPFKALRLAALRRRERRILVAFDESQA